jgi:hypothetical protein
VFYGKTSPEKAQMVKKHTIRKETNINAETGDINIVEEHVIIEKHDFLHLEEEDDEDMMFLGKKDQDEGDDEDNPLFIVNSDDNFW